MCCWIRMFSPYIIMDICFSLWNIACVEGVGVCLCVEDQSLRTGFPAHNLSCCLGYPCPTHLGVLLVWNPPPPISDATFVSASLLLMWEAQTDFWLLSWTDPLLAVADTCGSEPMDGRFLSFYLSRRWRDKHYKMSHFPQLFLKKH